MGRKLFVGGLSWGTNDESLRASFERFGEIEEAKVITDRETGRSRGFGFVTFSQEECAMNAISAIDGSQIDGREVKVNEAWERQRRDAAQSFGGGNRYSSYGR